MSCDGSGEMRWGHICPGCDACEGRANMRYTPAPDFWAPAGGPRVPAVNPYCPWCLTEHKGYCPPDAVEKAWANLREGSNPA